MQMSLPIFLWKWTICISYSQSLFVSLFLPSRFPASLLDLFCRFLLYILKSKVSFKFLLWQESGLNIVIIYELDLIFTFHIRSSFGAIFEVLLDILITIFYIFFWNSIKNDRRYVGSSRRHCTASIKYKLGTDCLSIGLFY